LHKLNRQIGERNECWATRAGGGYCPCRQFKEAARDESSGGSEDCCFNYTRDLCQAEHGGKCVCGCHGRVKRVARRDWEILKIQDFERLEAENRRLREALKLIAGGVWTAKNSIEVIVWTARRALQGDGESLNRPNRS
jgi:hypothetical protein